jgi:hypothetical protein
MEASTQSQPRHADDHQRMQAANRREGLFSRNQNLGLVMGTLVDGAGLAGGSDASLAHDGADRAGAAAAIRAAAEAGIDLADDPRAFRTIAEAGPDVVVTQHVAMANNHCTPSLKQATHNALLTSTVRF